MRVHRLLVVLFGLSSAVMLAVPPQDSRVVIDGELNDRFWQEVASAQLVPAEAGVPPETGGEIRTAMAGRYLYLGARLPEPDGRLAARSIGRNPVWEGGELARHADSPRHYSYGVAEGEDFVRVVIRVYNENDWMLKVGPLGAYSVKWRWTGEGEWYTSRPEKCDRFLVAAGISEKEWRVEVAIPLDQLGSPAPGSIRLSVERNRPPRPGQPGQRWRWPANQPSAEVPAILADDRKLSDPIFQPPSLGNREPPIEVGRRDNLPPLESRWTDPAWRDVPVWGLRRNEAAGRLPNFPTEVKLLHNGRTLAVLARCIEPDRVVAHAKEGERGNGQDDSFQIYLAASGSSYAHYAINPLGFILQAAGHSGGPRVSRSYGDWASPVRGMARQEQGEWMVRLDLPLDSIAQILDEVQAPREWRILLLRSRPGRDGEPQETSVLPVTESVTPLCPARYRRIRFVDSDPSQLRGAPGAESTGNLASFPSRVLSFEQRKEMDLAAMLGRNIRGRVLKVLQAEKHDWDQVQTVDDWERFRDPRLKALAATLGKFPPRCPLETRMTKEFRGEGYCRQDLVYQSQPGFWVTANLYLPAESQGQMPGIIIVHSLHGPKTQFELQDMGILWARAGCAVLIMDQIGYGERIENYPWDRENYHSRYVTGEQLYLVGESLMTWMVWDIMRGVDLLLERKDINEKQIILLGAVAGGGDPAAVTAALDRRIAAVVPFNFGESTPEVPRFLPEKNQWPSELADPGLDDWDSTRCLRRAIADQFLQWFVCASVAPRRFVYSYELGWNVEDLPAWVRYQKVFGFYHALDHLADAHGFGPFPGPGECWNIGPAQRRSLYPTLERWFGIPSPFTDAKSSVYDNLAKRPTIDRRPESELDVLTPAIASELRRQSVHELAYAEGRAKLEAARAQRARFKPQEQREWVRSRWSDKLGEIAPNRHSEATLQWTKQAPDARVEAITLTVEPDVVVPLLLLRPKSVPGARPPVVIAVAEGGKDLFLARWAGEIEALLKGGVAVCLPDVRGTGETSPDSRRDPDSDEIMQANDELMLGDTLLGSRLKDLRSVLSYLEARQDLDAQRIGLWGDSFSPANPARLTLDEFPQWPVGPEIEEQAEPLGGLLALLGALYEDNVRAVAIRGGLSSFLSILQDRFAYVPADVIVPGILEVGDIAEVAATLAPRPVLLEGLVDGRNRHVPEAALRRELDPVYKAYGEMSPADLTIHSGPATSNLAEWFLARLSSDRGRR
jgi:dienelactone hydrolase